MPWELPIIDVMVQTIGLVHCIDSLYWLIVLVHCIGSLCWCIVYDSRWHDSLPTRLSKAVLESHVFFGSLFCGFVCLWCGAAADTVVFLDDCTAINY